MVERKHGEKLWSVETGHTGVSFYGGTKEQTLMITDGGLWYGGEANRLPDVHHALERMRSKMDQGMFKEASWELVNELKRQGYHSKLESPSSCRRSENTNYSSWDISRLSEGTPDGYRGSFLPVAGSGRPLSLR